MSDPTAHARALVEAGRYRDALTTLGAALAREPENQTALCLVAQCHLALGDPKRADVAAQGALRVGPDGEWPHRLRSIALMRNLRYLEARVEARKAIAAAPWQFHGYVQLATVDCVAREVDTESWDAARRAVELAPHEADAHFALGHVAMLSKSHRLARAQFLEALRLEPDNAAARNNLAVISLRRARLFSALKHLMGALRLDPQEDVFQRNLRLVLRIWVSLAAVVGAFGGLPAYNATGRRTWYTTEFLDAAGQPVDPTQAVIGNQLIYPTQVAHHGPVPHGWTGPLVGYVAGIVGVCLVVALLLWSALGRRLPAVLRASMKSDRILALSVACVAVEVSGALVALGVGLPHGRVYLGVAVAAAWLAVFARVAPNIGRRFNRRAGLVASLTAFSRRCGR